MSAHPSIQDLSSEAELVSHDTSPLPSVGYRQHACISDSWRPQAGLGSRHDGIRSAPSCTNFIKLQDKLKLVLRVKDSRTAPPRVGCLSLEPSRRNNLCPKTGLEPVIALLEGKCLNHLNYSGSYNCCMRLFFGKEEHYECWSK